MRLRRDDRHNGVRGSANAGLATGCSRLRRALFHDLAYRLVPQTGRLCHALSALLGQTDRGAVYGVDRGEKRAYYNSFSASLF